MSEIPKLLRYEFTVPSEAIDFNGHVDNVTYLRWFVEAALRHANTLGWGIEACRQKGTGWVAKSHRIEYLRPAFEGETLTMTTWIAEVGRIKALRRYELYRNDTLIALCESEWVYIDAQSGRPLRLPESMQKAVNPTP